jgi:hypothetical protein
MEEDIMEEVLNMVDTEEDILTADMEVDMEVGMAMGAIHNPIPMVAVMVEDAYKLVALRLQQLYAAAVFVICSIE